MSCEKRRSICLVGACKNIGNHLFPTDEDLKAQCIQAIEYFKPGLTIRKYSKICSSHVKPGDFHRTPLPLLQPVKNMKFVQFVYNNNPSEIRVGYVDPKNNDCLIDINKGDSSLPTTLLEVLKNGDFEKVKNLASKNPQSIPMSSVALKAPIHGVDKVLCIGLNYKDHCEEQNLEPPKVPMIFSKFASCLIGPSDPLKLRTDSTQKVDWELEMAIVIGKKASRVKAANATDYIFGYTVAQDISARDWQKEKNAGQFLLGKAMDGFCPIGPCIVTADEVSDANNLNVRCTVNGVEKQKSNTKNLIHKIPDVIERLTSIMTLLPGDMILTGTPGGVGVHRKPAEFLKPGDTVCSEIQCIGTLVTKVEQF